MQNKQEYQYSTLTMTDPDKEYRGKLEEIAKWLHDENPFDFSPSHRRRFKLKTKRGDTIKVAIDRLYQEMKDNAGA